MIVYGSDESGQGYTTKFRTGDIGQEAHSIRRNTWLTVDVNGDGKTEIVQLFHYHGDQRARMIVYGWVEGQGYTTKFGPGEMYSTVTGTVAWLTVDVNGDGKTEIAHLQDLRPH
jgi:hypothetical protein